MSFLFSGIIFSQQDVSIGNISIVGGEPICPSRFCKISSEISVTGAPDANDVEMMIFIFK